MVSFYQFDSQNALGRNNLTFFFGGLLGIGLLLFAGYLLLVGLFFESGGIRFTSYAFLIIVLLPNQGKRKG